MNKEYTYNIDKYTIGVDKSIEERISSTIAMIENDKINILGNYYGDNARCIDLLIEENQKLKKDFNKVVHESTEFESKVYELEAQQKEFIEWLKYELRTSYLNSSQYYYFLIALSKYKEIIGDKDE